MAKSNLELLRDLAKGATASPAFDMEAFNRDNPVIEGKEFEPLSEVSKKPKKIATSKRVADADVQASKMKSTTKKAYQILPPGKAPGSQSPSPKPYVKKTRKPDADVQAGKMKAIKAMVGPGEQATMVLEAMSSPLTNWGENFRKEKEPKKEKPPRFDFRRKPAATKSLAFIITEDTEKGAIHSPGALAAFIGRKKYGSKKYGKMSSAGKHHSKKTSKPGGGKRFQRLESKLSHQKSFAERSQNCANCNSPATVSMPKLNSANKPSFNGQRINLCNDCHQNHPHLSRVVPSGYFGANKSVYGGKLAKAGIGYIAKHYSGKYCTKCHDPLNEDNADIHSATYGERHFKGALCKSCAGKMRD